MSLASFLSVPFAPFLSFSVLPQSVQARYQVGHAIMSIISIGRTASTIFYCSFFITTKHPISVQESKTVYACISGLLQKYVGSVYNHKWLQNF